MNYLKAPFPYFGGKSIVAPIVWEALGGVKHYIEPFFGSGAVLLARPGYNSEKHIETVNDKDGFIANVWRAIKFAPDEVAKWCDWPVNHADLMARRKELLKNESKLLAGLVNDPLWFDPVIAGYWVWAASCWIGHGLTRPGAIPRLMNKVGVHVAGQRPQLTNKTGVNATNGCKRPSVTHARGCQTTQLSNNNGVTRSGKNIYEWFNTLSDRLRHVQVVCGDFSQVMGGNWQDARGTCGVFFDPPYGGKANRDKRIYHKDCLNVAQVVAAWSLDRGQDPAYRIILAGYLDEHKDLIDHGWTFKRWSASGGYSSADNDNRHKETLFFSPYCMTQQRLNFDK